MELKKTTIKYTCHYQRDTETNRNLATKPDSYGKHTKNIKLSSKTIVKGRG
jgi:hypothetical protein